MANLNGSENGFAKLRPNSATRNQESAFWIIEKLKHLKGVSTANAAQSIWRNKRTRLISVSI
jgi:hypothetical protein